MRAIPKPVCGARPALPGRSVAHKVRRLTCCGAQASWRPNWQNWNRQRERLRYESGGRHDHLPSRSRKASTRSLPTRPRGISSGCSLEGMCTGCWCESVDGLLRNIRNGWPTLSCIRCWLPEDRVRCKAGNKEEIDMSVAVTALHDKFELERTNHRGRGRRSQTAAVFLRCLGKA